MGLQLPVSADGTVPEVGLNGWMERGRTAHYHYHQGEETISISLQGKNIKGNSTRRTCCSFHFSIVPFLFLQTGLSLIFNGQQPVAFDFNYTHQVIYDPPVNGATTKETQSFKGTFNFRGDHETICFQFLQLLLLLLPRRAPEPGNRWIKNNNDLCQCLMEYETRI